MAIKKSVKKENEEKRLFEKDQMFVNAIYQAKDYKNPDSKDAMIVVYKNKDGVKNYKYIEEPKYSYYVTKDIQKQYQTPGGYEYRYISLEEVNKITTKYNCRYASMVKNTTNPDVKKMYKDKSIPNNQLHLFKEFHGSDVNITDYYINKFFEENNFNDNIYPLNISCFDIEVDGADYEGFPEEDFAPCPVNMISYYNFVTNKLTILALRYETETFQECIDGKIKEMIEDVKKVYNKYFPDFTIGVKLFRNELKLIKGFFDLVNTDKPDYCTAWNARFDIITLHNRLRYLLQGTDFTPADIMCPRDFPIKKVNIEKDTSAESQKDFTARTDKFDIFGYTNWMDMLPLYGNITRPFGKKESYSLNAIGLEVTGLAKEDLSAEDTSIKTAHLDNYSLFFKYSCVDTMLLSLIVKNTGYIDLLHTIVSITHTRASKALTKTVCIRNFIDSFYKKKGYTISNNRSYTYTFDRTGISGAFVAPPGNIAKVGWINSIPSNKVFDLVIDEDLSSMYPYILIVCNMSSSTLTMKVTVIKDTGEFEIKMDDKGNEYEVPITEDITKDFMEKYLSDNVVNFCNEFHELPSYDEVYAAFAA